MMMSINGRRETAISGQYSYAAFWDQKAQGALVAPNIANCDCASRAQRELFVSQGWPDDRITMSYRYLPSHYVGGDMFGCIPQDDGRLCFYVADISGQGASAAIITPYLVKHLKGERFDNASQMLNLTRDAFMDICEDELRYVAMFAAILNPDTGELLWANAGMNAVPLLFHENHVEHLYEPATPISNWFEGVEYVDHKLSMSAGDRLLLYTDGLFDAKSSRATEEEIESMLLEMEGDELLENLERQVLNRRRDDVCMILITRNRCE